jgi:Putative quorum-sensing-regulated virulence factor
MESNELNDAVRSLETKKQLKDLQETLRRDPDFQTKFGASKLKLPDDVRDERDLHIFTVLPEVMTFGKYKGMKLSEVPADYLEWLIEQQINSTVKYRTELEKRELGTKYMQTYTVRIQSEFVVTATHVKNSMGPRFRVVSVETERDSVKETPTSVRGAVWAILKSGYRALARAYHPDLGGDTEVMVNINKELAEKITFLLTEGK